MGGRGGPSSGPVPEQEQTTTAVVLVLHTRTAGPVFIVGPVQEYTAVVLLYNSSSSMVVASSSNEEHNKRFICLLPVLRVCLPDTFRFSSSDHQTIRQHNRTENIIRREKNSVENRECTMQHSCHLFFGGGYDVQQISCYRLPTASPSSCTAAVLLYVAQHAAEL